MNSTTKNLSEFAAICAALAPVVRAAVRTWLTPTRLAHVTDLANMAVEAAETLKTGNGATNDDAAEFAAKVVADGAKRLGVKLTADEVMAFVHAALADMKHAQADAVTA